MRSQLISVYKFPKAGKVKQLRLGNERERRSVEELQYDDSRSYSIVSNSSSVPFNKQFGALLVLISLICTEFVRLLFDWY